LTIRVDPLPTRAYNLLIEFQLHTAWKPNRSGLHADCPRRPMQTAWAAVRRTGV